MHACICHCNTASSLSTHLLLAAAKADDPAASGREASGSGAKTEARAKAADAKRGLEPRAGREVDRPASRWTALVGLQLSWLQK